MRSFQNIYYVLVLILLLQTFSEKYYCIDNKNDILFSFGLLTDCQYKDTIGTGVRKYSLSKTKLNECVSNLNKRELAFVAHLGDFIDDNISSFDNVNPIFNKLNFPKYHVLGNHDFSVVDNQKTNIPKMLNMENRYYDFKINDWHFIILDGNDISFYAYPNNSKEYQFAKQYYDNKEIKSPKWNGAIGENQIEWLKKILISATANNENVILFCHFPIYPENNHNLWNATEILEILKSSSSVKAFISGHNHKGNYGEKDGIHFLTLKGMVDSIKNSYAIMNVYKNKLELVGFGRELNRIMKLK